MATETTLTQIMQIAADSGIEIVDRQHLPARKPSYAPVPSRLDDAVRNLLITKYPNGMFGHQALAIDAALDGDDLCLATSTSSGKSLVFLTVAAHLLRRTPSSKVLALYPARALIQDQIQKWTSILEPLGMALGYIDGGVSLDSRAGILSASNVVLMTPDVAHAWLMSHLRNREEAEFLASFRLLILDEAHVYEGVFGTNMAFFLRRLQAVSGPHQIICCTATLGAPHDFVQQLTGRRPRCFGIEDDRSLVPPKCVLLAREARGKSFDSMVSLLRALAKSHAGRFLAFGDSRGMVEQIVAATYRSSGSGADDEVIESPHHSGPSELSGQEAGVAATRPRILPYRAGYETEDRNEIQKALQMGDLAGVVCTSALELGIDIGEIDLVVLLGLPQTMKSFWQRIGRSGRRSAGVCLAIDDRGRLVTGPGTLDAYLQRPLEPNCIYLENRYLQYVNALCAAVELGDEYGNGSSFESLPASFRRLLENELSPTESVADDLYLLKQRAQSEPHREFPLRTGTEKNFRVIGPFQGPLGTLTFPQVMREAYPGGIYYYMARPYRVCRFDYRNGEIIVKREKHWTTRPIAQAMVFPRFDNGVLQLSLSNIGFIAETEMQVSERVMGFIEQRGSTKTEHRYGPGSPYRQRELPRFFRTTGVCWYFPEPIATSEIVAKTLLEVFCIEFGIQSRDLGVGLFHSRQSPLGLGTCKGICIFDATNGSLRLTERLAQNFSDVLTAAIALGRSREDTGTVSHLQALETLVKGVCVVTWSRRPEVLGGEDSDWVPVIASGERAMFMSPYGTQEVEVKDVRFTPRGLVYELVPQQRLASHSVPATLVHPIEGETRLVRFNLMTAEIEPTT